MPRTAILQPLWSCTASHRWFMALLAFDAESSVRVASRRANVSEGEVNQVNFLFPCTSPCAASALDSLPRDHTHTLHHAR